MCVYVYIYRYTYMNIKGVYIGLLFMHLDVSKSLLLRKPLVIGGRSWSSAQVVTIVLWRQTYGSSAF